MYIYIYRERERAPRESTERAQRKRAAREKHTDTDRHRHIHTDRQRQKQTDRQRNSVKTTLCISVYYLIITRFKFLCSYLVKYCPLLHTYHIITRSVLNCHHQANPLRIITLEKHTQQTLLNITCVCSSLLQSIWIVHCVMTVLA